MDKEVDGIVFKRRIIHAKVVYRSKDNLYLHRYLYEQYNNCKLTKGKNIHFADGNTENFAKDNLVLQSPRPRYIECEVDCIKGTVCRGESIPHLDSGYLKICYKGKECGVHRIIYEVYHGITLRSDQIINHKNWNTLDNRICNLELVTKQQNCQWRQLPTTGYKGVSVTKNGKYQAEIRYNKRIYLGTFPTALEAARAYDIKADELNKSHDCRFSLNSL